MDFYTYLADDTKCAVIGDYDAGFDYIGSLLYLKMEEDKDRLKRLLNL